MAQKSSFGLDQIDAEQPKWAKYLFRGWFVFSKAFLGWAAATTLIPKETLYEITISITLLADPIIYGISKMFGIQVEEADPSKTLIADKQIEQDGQVTKVVPVMVNSQDLPLAIGNAGVTDDQPTDVIKSDH